MQERYEQLFNPKEYALNPTTGDAEDNMIILRKYTNCTEEERKALVSTDISIACVDKRIATLKELLDTSLREICFNRIKELEGYKAKLHYEKLLFAFPSTL